jgi:hypothetical protein
MSELRYDNDSKQPELGVGGIETAFKDQEMYGTVNDKTDMARLGKLQQLRVSRRELLS